MGKCKIPLGGGTMGKYVWICKNIIPAGTVTNPSFTGIEYSGSTSSMFIANETFDLSRVDDFKEFFVGFKAQETNAYGREFVRATNGQLQLVVESIRRNVTGLDTRYKALSFQDSNYLFEEVRFTYVFDGQKTLAPAIGDIKGYVTSNNPNAYPNGDVKGGYYYELLGSVAQATSYGITGALTTSIKDDAITEVQEEIINGNV